MAQPGAQHHAYGTTDDHAASDRQRCLDGPKPPDHPAIRSSPAQQRHRSLVVGSPAETGEHGDSEEQHQQRADRNRQPVLGDPCAAVDRQELVLGAGDVKTGRRRVCCDCADPADQSAEVDGAEIAGDDRCLPGVRTPDELQGRERRGWSHAVGHHDQLTVVRTELAAQHQVAGGDRCAHDGESEGRTGREWRDPRGAPQIADEGHHFASISVAACRPHTVDQPSDAVEIVEPRKSNRAAVARRQCTKLDGTNRGPETLSLQPAVNLGVEPIEIRGGGNQVG